jgi:hypothetical protein
MEGGSIINISSARVILTMSCATAAIDVAIHSGAVSGVPVRSLVPSFSGLASCVYVTGRRSSLTAAC